MRKIAKAAAAAALIAGSLSLIPAPASAAAAGCSASYRLLANPAIGFQAEVTVTNTGDVTNSGWLVRWVYENGERVTSVRNAIQVITVGPLGTHAFRNTPRNGLLAPKQSTTFSVSGQSTGRAGVPEVECTPTR